MPATPQPVSTTTDPEAPAHVGSEALVDPAVSRAKFERELASYRAIAADRRRLGWWMLSAEFPEVLVAFVAPQLRPAGVVFGALLDFTNYDLWAPSVKLVNPFTGVPYRAKELPPALTFMRRVPLPQPVQIPGIGSMETFTEQPLLIAHGQEEVPFFCIPGVREYHDHPAHTGDDWLLHRGQGEGTLFFLLEKLYHYGVAPLKGYQFGLQITGFLRPESPE
jgi:hypothetical protein